MVMISVEQLHQVAVPQEIKMFVVCVRKTKGGATWKKTKKKKRHLKNENKKL